MDYNTLTSSLVVLIVLALTVIIALSFYALHISSAAYGPCALTTSLYKSSGKLSLTCLLQELTNNYLHRKSLIRLLVQEIGTLECLKSAGPCHGFAANCIKVSFPNEQMMHVVNNGSAIETVYF